MLMSHNYLGEEKLQDFEVPENVEGNIKAMCKHCQTLVSGSTKATSNFLYHLKA